MNHVAPRRSTILVMHPDPLLRAGLVGRPAPARGLRDLRRRLSTARSRTDPGSTSSSPTTTTPCALPIRSDPAHDTLAAARILVLTTNDREADIRRAIEAGIHGYILLGGPLDELIEGATTVANGLRYVSRSAAQRMADSLTRTPLTSREIEVLSLVVSRRVQQGDRPGAPDRGGDGQVAHDGDHDQAGCDLAHPGRRHRSHARPGRAARRDAAHGGSAASGYGRRARAVFVSVAVAWSQRQRGQAVRS